MFCQVYSVPEYYILKKIWFLFDQQLVLFGDPLNHLVITKSFDQMEMPQTRNIVFFIGPDLMWQKGNITVKAPVCTVTARTSVWHFAEHVGGGEFL